MIGIAIICGLTIFLFIMAAVNYLSGKHSGVEGRLRQYAEIDRSSKDQAAEQQSLRNNRLLAPVFKAAALFTSLPQLSKIEHTMQLAGLPLKAAEFVSLTVVSSLVIFTAAVLIMFNSVQPLLLTFLWLICIKLYIDRLITKRRQDFDSQLCDAIPMMSNAVKTGFSFMQVLSLIAEEMPQPIAGEFARTMREIQLGVVTEDALTNMAKRIQSPDLELVVTAVIIQRQIGGSLATVLDNISETINSRIKIKREIKTITAEGRFSGWIIAAMPFIMAGMFLLSNPHYFDEFLDSEFGLLAFAIAFNMQLLGMIIIRRLVDIKI